MRQPGRTPQNRLASQAGRTARLAGSKVRNATREDENEDALVPQLPGQNEASFQMLQVGPVVPTKIGPSGGFHFRALKNEFQNSEYLGIYLFPLNK